MELIRSTIRLAGELGVRKIVTMSGNPGDGPTSTAVNFTWYPWPDDSMALLERQWTAAIDAVAGPRSAGRTGGRAARVRAPPAPSRVQRPDLERMRDAVGPVIGVNLDPSHLFWQGMDPLAVVRALGPAIRHVHLKDTQVIAEQVALAGVLDQRPFADPAQRAWVFRTVGSIHDSTWWSAFVDALRDVGYDDALAIENEDASLPPEAAVEAAARFMHPILARLTPLSPGPASSSLFATRKSAVASTSRSTSASVCAPVRKPRIM